MDYDTYNSISYKKGREEKKRQVKEAKYRYHHLGIKRNSSSGHIFSDRCRLGLGMNYGEVNASLVDVEAESAMFIRSRKCRSIEAIGEVVRADKQKQKSHMSY